MDSEQHFTVELTREELHSLVTAIMFSSGFEPPDGSELPMLREVAARLLRLVAEERTRPIAVTIVPKAEHLRVLQPLPSDELEETLTASGEPPRERA